MTEEDLNAVESVLAISLPIEYRETMLNFPIPACAGNDDTYLWDNAERLIAENKELRGGRRGGPPWPNHFFCLGRAGGGDVYAIDLRDPRSPVWWVDHSILDLESSGREAGSFSDWVAQYIADLRSDLAGDGVEPDGSPEEREEVEARNATGGCLSLLLLVAAVAAVMLLVKRIF
jgi:hypothetical protein